jgi:hypothetical protein
MDSAGGSNRSNAQQSSGQLGAGLPFNLTSVGSSKALLPPRASSAFFVFGASSNKQPAADGEAAAATTTSSACNTSRYNPLGFSPFSSLGGATSSGGSLPDISTEHSLQEVAENASSCRTQVVCGNLLFEAFVPVPLGEQQEPPEGQQRRSNCQVQHAGDADSSSAAAATAAALAAAAAVQDALGMHSEGER